MEKLRILDRFQRAANAVFSALARFPVAIFSAVLATVFMVAQMHGSWTERAPYYYWMWPSFLGISLGALVTLWSESRRHPRSLAILLSIALLICDFLLAYYWKGAGLDRNDFAMRYVQLGLAVHLALAFLPTQRIGVNGFWQFNRFLFWRFFYIAVLALIIYAGLFAALAAVNYLLGLNIKETIYLDLFCVVFFFYHPVAFLAGMPADLEGFEQTQGSPREINVLCHYILLPLVGLYLAILYLYLGRIVVLWELPKGGVGYLVSGFATVGILAFLLLEPAIRAKEGAKTQHLRSIFFFLLIPLLILLFIGLVVRTGAYGWTAHRYLLAAYGLWLAGMVGYFLISSRRDIRVIPATLGALAIASLFGPWSAYELPPWLQRKQLQALLESTGILKDGQASPTDRVINPSQHRRIRDGFDYLIKTSQRDNVREWFGGAEITEFEMMERLKIPYYLDSQNVYRYFNTARGKPLSIKGYSVLIDSIASYEGDGYRLDPSGTKAKLKKGPAVLCEFDLTEAMKLPENSEPPTVECPKGKLYVEHLRWDMVGTRPELSSVGGKLLLK